MILSQILTKLSHKYNGYIYFFSQVSVNSLFSYLKLYCHGREGVAQNAPDVRYLIVVKPVFAVECGGGSRECLDEF